MKVLLINGSPRINGNTALALAEMEKTNEGIRHRIFCAIKKAGLDGYETENK